jgi:hypothetical protein
VTRSPLRPFPNGTALTTLPLGSAGGGLRLQLRNPGLQRGDGLLHLRLGEARGDVLGAVPVEAHHFDEEEALDFAAQFGRGRELIGEGGVLAGVEKSSPFLLAAGICFRARRIMDRRRQ